MIKTIISFATGFLLCWTLFYSLFYLGESIPLTDLTTNTNNKAPGNWIQEKDITIKGEYIQIHAPNASLSKYAATGSMKPTLDKGTNGIRIPPQGEETIQEGDIISYKWGNNIIVHRVIEKGKDEKGTYYITKGDNNNLTDGKIRYKDILYITIGVLW
jgi:signal peptidase I